MPRKSISIDEAFAALEEAGIHVQRVKPEPVLQPAPAVVDIEMDYSVYPPRPKGVNAPQRQKAPVTHMRIPLYARHSITSGESRESYDFGPGMCTVPTELARTLLYQDQLAKEADARLLETEQRCYMIVRRQSGDGYIRNSALRVDKGMLDNIGLLDTNFIV